MAGLRFEISHFTEPFCVNQNIKTVQRPPRWDQPFDPAMTDSLVQKLLQIPPFSGMEAAAFSPSVPLSGILMHDCRFLDLKKGDIIVREGDYGSSAFLILSGHALVALQSLPAHLLGRKSRKPKGWAKIIAQLWNQPSVSEVRTCYDTPSNGSGSSDSFSNSGVLASTASDSSKSPASSPTAASGTGVFLQDIPRLIRAGESAMLQAGEIFGEIAALTRTPRSSTVMANSEMQVLEIRWQGFRELMKRHESMRRHIENQYRENSLREHLRETPLFKNLAANALQEIADSIEFESFGNFQWDQAFKSTQQHDISARILAEPLIVTQGEYINGLILIRNGFARLSRQHGEGQQTIAYLGKGQIVGLRELVHNWRTGEQRSWLLSLRAVGYVDILRVPTAICEKWLLPALSPDQTPSPLPTLAELASGNVRRAIRQPTIEPGLTEFLVEERLINGTQAMVIDLDRCTRCDDCVRACAATHNGNPRFNRTGKKHDHWLVANACMHCLDPVCMIGCPTGAIGRETESGNVTINDQTCIGCSTCANSCPYGNIQMVEINHPNGDPMIDRTGLPILKATKCDLCSDQRGGPACQRACPHDALTRIDLSTPAALTQWSKRK
jgi:Fe-S-cluster-containing dehydrogenase component/CRP-like cAMP-binding protein